MTIAQFRSYLGPYLRLYSFGGRAIRYDLREIDAVLEHPNQLLEIRKRRLIPSAIIFVGPSAAYDAGAFARGDEAHLRGLHAYVIRSEAIAMAEAARQEEMRRELSEIRSRRAAGL